MAHAAGSPVADRWVTTAEWLSNNILLCDDVHTGDKERATRTGYLTFISNTWERVFCESSRGKHPLVCSVRADVFLVLHSEFDIKKIILIIIIFLFSKNALHSSKVTVK